jgi:hypothetical protein
MLAIALGLKAVQAGSRVHYTTAADLVARTSRAASQGRWENTMRFWAGPQVLIVDELGYLPMVGEAGSHLFQVISRRYLHAGSSPSRSARSHNSSQTRSAPPATAHSKPGRPTCTSSPNHHPRESPAGPAATVPGR